MKIAVAAKNFEIVSGHAGQARLWLLYDCVPGQPIPAPVHTVLSKEQLPHHFKDGGPHPLDGVDLLIAGSAGDGFIRHMAKRGTQVLLTGERHPAEAIKKAVAGEVLADPRFDVTTALCKLRDLFSSH